MLSLVLRGLSAWGEEGPSGGQVISFPSSYLRICVLRKWDNSSTCTMSTYKRSLNGLLLRWVVSNDIIPTLLLIKLRHTSQMRVELCSAIYWLCIHTTKATDYSVQDLKTLVLWLLGQKTSRPCSREEATRLLTTFWPSSTFADKMPLS